MSNESPFSLLVTAAADPSFNCERLVRAALVLAKAIGDDEFAAWCISELDGYYNRPFSDLPEYRWTQGVVTVKDRWGSVYPGQFQSAKDQERWARSNIAEPLGQVEKNAAVNADSQFYVTYSPEKGNALRKAFGDAIDVYRVIQPQAFQNVLTQVRQKLFMWAVDGTAREVPAALSSTIGNLLGITHAPALRPVAPAVVADALAGGSITLSHSNLIVNSTGTTATLVHKESVDLQALGTLVAELHRAIDAIPTDARPADLESAAEELKALSALSSPRPSFIREALASLRAVLEGGAGTVLGEVTKPHLLALLANVLRN